MSVTYKDYYEILGVDRSATGDAIKNSYRKLARKCHPDVSKEPGAEARFKEITEAYEVLKDPEKRTRYDSLGSGWHSGEEFRPPPGFENVRFEFGGGDQGLGGFSDFFASLFGGSRGGAGFGGGAGFDPAELFGQGGRVRREVPSQRGQDVEAELPLTVAELARGGQRSFSVQSSDGESRQYDVRIPPGVTDGSRIRLAGQGAPGRTGGVAGDLLLRVKVVPDPRFRVEGCDLRAAVDVAPWEAALGADVDVPTVEGTARLKVPAGSQSGQVLRLRGLGLPRTADARGDLLVKLRVVVPTTLTEEERRLYGELAEKSPFKPREH